MAILKCELLLEVVTVGPGHSNINPRDAGWSEAFWLDQDIEQAKVKLGDLAVARAGMLPVSGHCVGYRITPAINAGQAYSKAFSFPGGSHERCDMPQMALAIRMTTAAGINRTIRCAGLPDDVVKGGEYSPTTFFQVQVAEFVKLLKLGFGTYGVNRTNALKSISGITVGGLVTTVEPHGYVANEEVRFFRTRDIYGQTIRGNWKVIEPIAASTFTLRNYNTPGTRIYGAVHTGKVRKITPTFSGFTDSTRFRSTTRKVGAPFDRFRGKASKRR